MPSCFCGPRETTVCNLVPTSVTRPNGRTTSFAWDLYALPDGSGGNSYEVRMNKVSNSDGYSITYAYQDDTQTYGSPPSAG